MTLRVERILSVLGNRLVTLNSFQGLYSMKDAEINSAGRPFVYEPIKQRITKNVNGRKEESPPERTGRRNLDLTGLTGSWLLAVGLAFGVSSPGILPRSTLWCGHISFRPFVIR